MKRVAAAVSLALTLAGLAAAAEDSPLETAAPAARAARFQRAPATPQAGPSGQPAWTGSAPTFRSEREAAIAFLDGVRARFADQAIEYCAFILKRGDGYTFALPPRVGDRDGCPSPAATPEGATASAHTHPIPDRRFAGDLAASGQMFSENDYAFAETRRINIYLGGPAGHVLSYKPGATECRGDMIRHRYELARPPTGALSPRPDEFVYLAGARKEPFCLRPSR